jgi:hypothetical protein
MSSNLQELALFPRDFETYHSLMNESREHFSPALAMAVLLSSLVLGMGFAVPAFASATKTIPTCLNSQLEVAVAWGPGAAAGNIGVPFIIANDGKSACSLKGYPRLSIPYTYRKRGVKVVDGGGMVFVAVKPHPVILKPGADASFGLDYVDADNQQDPDSSACTAQYVYVTLPVQGAATSQVYETTVIFNFCFTNFQVSVTSIQPGPVPREG